MEISQEDFERAIEVVYMRGVVRESRFITDKEIKDIIADVYDLLKYDINASQPAAKADAVCICNPAQVGFIVSFNGPICTGCGKIR